MLSIFFRTTGLVYLSYIDKGKAIYSKLYIKGSLRALLREYKEQRPNYRLAQLKFQHDNARPLVSQRVITFLEGEKVTSMNHPPYAPDLAPSYF